MTSQAAKRDEPLASSLGTLYDEALADMYDDDSHGIYRRAYEDVMRSIPDGPAIDRVLDVGVGTGNVLRMVCNRFAPRHAFGVDPSTAMLAKASQKVDFLTAIEGDYTVFESDPRLKELDLVMANFVLSYVEPPKLFSYARDALRPGGRIVISTTTMNSFPEWERIVKHPIFKLLSMGYSISGDSAEEMLPPIPQDGRALAQWLDDAGFDVDFQHDNLHKIVFESGEEVYRFGQEGGWWLELYDMLNVTEKDIGRIHLAMRACQLLRLLPKPCTTQIETCVVSAVKR